MISDETAITNLLYLYAEAMDDGDFERAAAMFEHCDLLLDPENDIHTDGAGILAIWEQMVIRYECGTPRTKHVTTNPIIEIDGDTASCRSYYTVLQQVGDGPLHPVVAGRYHDTFEKVDGAWRFATRDYSLMENVGDTSGHLR